jgi:hypothetical protein
MTKQSPRSLIEIALNALNQVPNTRLADGTNTYDVAAQLGAWLRETKEAPKAVYVVAERHDYNETMTEFDKWDDLIDHLADAAGLTKHSLKRPVEGDEEQWTQFEDLVNGGLHKNCQALMVGRLDLATGKLETIL